MKKDETVYIREMLQLIENARAFTAGLSREDFLKDHKSAAAVLLEIVMLGEIAKRVPEEVRAAIAIPWRDITGFRDRAVHDYSKIDMEIVAGILFDRLDEVEQALRNYLVRE